MDKIWKFTPLILILIVVALCWQHSTPANTKPGTKYELFDTISFAGEPAFHLTHVDLDYAVFHEVGGCTYTEILVAIDEINPKFPYLLVDTRIERDSEGQPPFIILGRTITALERGIPPRSTSSTAAVPTQEAAQSEGAIEFEPSVLPQYLRQCGS